MKRERLKSGLYVYMYSFNTNTAFFGRHGHAVTDTEMSRYDRDF